jgi:hypothetical protein
MDPLESCRERVDSAAKISRAISIIRAGGADFVQKKAGGTTSIIMKKVPKYLWK